MQVHEIMTRDVTFVDPNSTVRDAAKRMPADNIGAIPVGENDRLIGMVTDRDITMRGRRGPFPWQHVGARGHVRTRLLLFRGR